MKPWIPDHFLTRMRDPPPSAVETLSILGGNPPGSFFTVACLAENQYLRRSKASGGRRGGGGGIIRSDPAACCGLTSACWQTPGSPSCEDGSGTRCCCSNERCIGHVTCFVAGGAIPVPHRPLPNKKDLPREGVRGCPRPTLVAATLIRGDGGVWRSEGLRGGEGKGRTPPLPAEFFRRTLLRGLRPFAASAATVVPPLEIFWFRKSVPVRRASGRKPIKRQQT